LQSIILFAIKIDFYNTHAIGLVSWCFLLKVGNRNDDGGGITIKKRRKLWLM